MLPKIGPSVADVDVHIWPQLEWCVSCFIVVVHFRFKLELPLHVVAVHVLESRTGPRLNQNQTIASRRPESHPPSQAKESGKFFRFSARPVTVATPLSPRRPRRTSSKGKNILAAGSVYDYVSKRMRRVLPFRWTLVDKLLLCRRLHRHHHHHSQT